MYGSGKNYTLRADGDEITFVEGLTEGTLRKNGDWYEGELKRENQRHGYIRLKRTDEGMRSQFKRTSEKAWESIAHIDARRAGDVPPLQCEIRYTADNVSHSRIITGS